MAAEDCGTAGENRVPDLCAAARQSLRGEVGRAEGFEHLGQTGRFHARRSVGRQQFERRGRAGQTRARQMEVAHRRADVAVSEQALDGVDIDAGFEQMGGEGVPPMPRSA